VNKNLLNDPRIGCKPFSSLIELIESNATLKKGIIVGVRGIWKKHLKGTRFYKYSLLLK
jgi:hypothetical protein